MTRSLFCASITGKKAYQWAFFFESAIGLKFHKDIDLKPLTILFAAILVLISPQSFGKSPATGQIKNPVSSAITVPSQDARGKTVRLEKPPTRIASATVASDECLWLILRQAGKLSRLSAVSTLSDSEQYSNISAEAKRIPGRIGGSLEHLLTLKPDLVVLANFNRPELIAKTESLGIPAWVLDSFYSMDDISRTLTQLGQLVHEPAAAANVVQKFKDDQERIRSRIRPGPAPRILGLNMDKTAWGTKTLFDDMVTLVGGVNALSAAKLQGWPKLSSEFLLTLNPDWIVMSGDESEKADILKTLQNWPELRSWKALKEKRLILIPAKDLHSASPWIINGVKTLQKGIRSL